MKYIIISPWHRKDIYEEFLEAWGLTSIPPWLLLEQDVNKIGCARMKNYLIRKAYDMGAEYIGVLDSDCHPILDGKQYYDRERNEMVTNTGLEGFMERHIKALEPQEVEMFEAVTNPPSRGTPYYNRTITVPVAASIGFWQGVPDWDAPSQLVRGDEKMEFRRKTIYGRYFAFSGMNFAFHRDWIDCAELIDIERMDDIFMGFVWQKIAYERGYCFNLNGPLINHSRQSNVWQNLRQEAKYLEFNETLWQTIHKMPSGLSASELRKRFPLFEIIK